MHPRKPFRKSVHTYEQQFQAVQSATKFSLNTRWPPFFNVSACYGNLPTEFFMGFKNSAKRWNQKNLITCTSVTCVY